MNPARTMVLGSCLAAVVLVALLVWNPQDARDGSPAHAVVCYCAAGIKLPVEAAARQYQEEYGVEIQLQYGGSGTLLSNVRVARTGDLYLAADDSYIEMAREQGLVDEAIPLAHIRPVIAVGKGNPKAITSIGDLSGDGVRVALANPDAAAVGKATRALLQKTGEWAKLKAHAKVFKPTVTDVANDIKLGVVDAGVIWDATVNQYPELEMVRVPAFDSAARRITIGLLKSTRSPTAALRFARYLGARDRGLRQFAKWGFEPMDGDVWEEKPRLILFSGGVNRLAIDETIKAFEKREGVRVETVYNGCGILCATMKAIDNPENFPDAYFSCDVSYLRTVRDMFLDSTDVSETDMVILTAAKNPKGIHSLEDLAKPGLKLGVANAEQSALGGLTRKLLEQAGLYDAVMKNVRSQTPTADLLVNQIRPGSLDAVIVYEANTAYVRDRLEIVRIDHPAAKAVQPYAVSKVSKHKYLMSRLLQAITSKQSKRHFESLGFRWRADLN